MRLIALIACFAFALTLLAACGNGESIPTPAVPDQDAAILEQGGNINLGSVACAKRQGALNYR